MLRVVVLSVWWSLAIRRQGQARILLRAMGDSQDDDAQQEVSDEDEESAGSKLSSLEEKMKGWEATEEEVKAATLGGMVPGNRSDAFDVGLYIAFPLMVLSGLAFAVFPLIMGNLDVDGVGPPPTM